MIHLPEKPAAKLFKNTKHPLPLTPFPPPPKKAHCLLNLQVEKKNPLAKQDPCKPYHVSDHFIRKGCLPVQTNKTTNEIHPNLLQQILLKLKWYMPIHESHPKAPSQKKQVVLIKKSRYPRSKTDSK